MLLRSPWKHSRLKQCNCYKLHHVTHAQAHTQHNENELMGMGGTGNKNVFPAHLYYVQRTCFRHPTIITVPLDPVLYLLCGELTVMWRVNCIVAS